MQLKDVLKDIEIIEMNADPELEICDIAYDSRLAGENMLFTAVRGFVTDGHKYIGAAAKNGAAAVICEEVPQEDIPYILVENSRKTLALASANFFGRPAEKMKIVGVTGTNGKTTSTTLIKNILESCGAKKVGLIGTNQNMIGSKVIPTERTTPESYDLQKLFAQMYEEGCDYVVMEVSSHSLVLDRVAGIDFEVAAFTNCTQDHLDFHKTMDNYIRAKALIFSQCKKSVINLDDEYAALLMESSKAPVFTYSCLKNEADIVAKNIRLREDRVEFCSLFGDRLIRTVLHIPGAFSVYNALTAVSCCLNLGFELDDIVKALASCGGVKGRAEVVPTGRDFTVLIDYAHTPDAMENILKTVRGYAKGRVIIVFGCGGDRDSTKRPIMGKVAQELADLPIVTSDNPRTEDPMKIIEDILAGMQGEPIVIPDRFEAIKWAIENAQKDDVIILAGKGHEDYQIIGREKRHFDEREAVAKILES